MQETDREYAVAVVAGGCFWCTEAVFGQLRGVVSVESGYTGGTMERPDYRSVCSGRTGHAEAVRIQFDPAEIGYADLLDIFFATHDPTQRDRQGNDIGTQYRSAIFPQNAAQQADARAAIARAAADHAEPIVTTIEPVAPFWPAEAEHDDYFNRVGTANPYCTVVIAPKLAKFRRQFADRLR